jgi:hypothetical protein
MTDVQPRLKPDPTVCVCGCGLVGQPKARAYRDGLGPHVRRCTCRRCSAPRHKANASRRERRIAKDTGGERSVLSGALSGYDGRAGLHVWEETSERAIVQTFQRWIMSKHVQSKLERLFNLSGYYRHFILSWGGKPRWVLTPYEDWRAERALEDQATDA